MRERKKTPLAGRLTCDVFGDGGEGETVRLSEP